MLTVAYAGGGGGAGTVYYGSFTIPSGSSVPVNVGKGGYGEGHDAGGFGTSGDNSTLTQPWGPTTITAPGGGGGGGEGADGQWWIKWWRWWIEIEVLAVEMLTPHLELLMQHLQQMDLEELVVTLMVVMVEVAVVPLVLVEMVLVMPIVLVQVVTDLV